MSRIHEALRRAEQEKTASLTAQKVEERVEYVAASGVIEAPAPSPDKPGVPVLQPAIAPQPETEARSGAHAI